MKPADASVTKELESVVQVCPSCGSPRMASYCPDCGERRTDPEELYLRRLLAQFFAAGLDLDGRFWVSLRALLVDPGRLSADAIAGRRRPWVGLVQLLLFCNLVYFLLQPLTGLNTLATSYESHLTDQLYSPLAMELVEQRLASTGEDREALREAMAAQLDTVSRALVVLLVPMLAGLLALMALPRRMPFGAQLLLAMELLAFQLLVVFLIVAGALRIVLFEAGLLSAVGLGARGELVLSVAVAVPILLWLAAALRRVHGFDLAAASWRAALLAGSMVVPILLYRVLVFMVALTTA